jgi:hypothetical protein
MRVFGIAATGVIIGLLAGVAYGQPPTAFVLRQNIPDPFCAGSLGGFTTFEFATPQMANIVLDIWSPDGTTLVKTLVNGTLQTGYHSVAWDGRNELGAPVASGAYPYRLTAREPGDGAVLYDATLVATVSCPVPSRASTWGLLKTLFCGAVR